MPVFIIETESRFNMKYAVEADTFDQAFRMVQNGLDDYKQEHIGEFLWDAKVVSDEELVYQIRLANNGLFSSWSDEKILEVFKHVAD